MNVRDHNGFVCAASAKAIPSSFGLLIAERIALRRGLTFIHDLGLLIHALESDALNVITVVQGVRSLDDTSIVLDDVRELLGKTDIAILTDGEIIFSTLIQGLYTFIGKHNWAAIPVPPIRWDCDSA
ncbi:hypothetical protein TIFTF001_046359 [Ficus carica]|uniref:RNase H type-1 domain-containing protein n=1 Tax=Ficus carica TaxID=3494 RepID=A0AA87ZUN4_FICCA|nr:hypothetical protein TIFTF001_046359 [Ficus carica]